MNCYKCKYRETLPGGAHSRCCHPDVNMNVEDVFDMIVAMFVSPQKVNEAAKKLNIQADPHGVKNGWFMWPGNFDPTWLTNCNGYVEK